MKSQEFNKVLKENGLVLDLNKNQTFLLEKIYQFQSKNDYFEIIEFQQLNEDIELEFIDEQLNLFQERKLLQYTIDSQGIIFNFDYLINLFKKLDQNIFFSYWSKEEKMHWIKKNLLLKIKSEIFPEKALEYIENNFAFFLEEYLRDVNFNFDNFYNKYLNSTSNLNIEKQLPLEKEQTSFKKETERQEMKMFFEDLDKKTIKSQKKLAQKNWFEEDE